MRSSELASKIPPELRQRYNSALEQVPRWEGAFWQPLKPENNLQHVQEMHRIESETQQFYPRLSPHVNWDDVSVMIDVHDMGEILTGDLTHGRLDFHDVRVEWKRQEHASAAWLLRKFIENPQVRIDLWTLYRRAMQKNPSDVESQVTDFIDKAQGARFGSQFVFNVPKTRGAQRQMFENHFMHTLALIGKPAAYLYCLIPEPGNKDVRLFFQRELERFGRFGYKSQAQEALGNLDTLLNPEHYSPSNP